MLLLVQSIPYGAALATSMASCMPRLDLVLPKLAAMPRLLTARVRRNPLG